MRGDEYTLLSQSLGKEKMELDVNKKARPEAGNNMGPSI